MLSGCSLSLFNGYRPAPAIGDTSIAEFVWFNDSTARYLYQAGIDIYNDHYGGLMLIKPVTSTSHRVFFMTEVGIKILDLELFKDGNYKIHYCIEELNSRFLIRTLVEDITLMIYNAYGAHKIKVLQEKNNGGLIIWKKDKTGTSYCYVDDRTDKVNKMVRFGSLAKKLIIQYYGIDNDKPDSVSISHYNIKLKINLICLNEERTDSDE